MIGKGQFTCGHKKCEQAEGLRTWEANFAYKEQGEKKNALVKLSEFCYSTGRKINTNFCIQDPVGDSHCCERKSEITKK